MENIEFRFNRIVVAIDGSAGAYRALQWAITLARRTGAEIVAVHVGQPIISDVAAYGFVGPIPTPDWQDDGAFRFERQAFRSERSSRKVLQARASSRSPNGRVPG